MRAVRELGPRAGRGRVPGRRVGGRRDGRARRGGRSGAGRGCARSWPSACSRPTTARRSTARASSRAYVAIVLRELPRAPRAAARPARAARSPADGAPAAGRCRRSTRVGELAERLELDPGQLAWLADVRGLERMAPTSACATTATCSIPRAGGPAAGDRAPEAAAEGAPALDPQRDPVLDPGPRRRPRLRPRPLGAHARRARTSARRVVVRLDLEDFFAAVTAGRVYGIFRTAGYPEAVAHTLTGPVHERRAAPRESGRRALPARAPAGRRRTCRRARRPRPRWPTSPRSGSTAA